MTDFVLLPGEWMGSWSWWQVIKQLRVRGHNVYPVTLPGLSPDDLIEAEDITLETHVDDVVDVLQQVQLRNGVLVGNSYAGMVAGIVAGQEPLRVRHTIFVDAFLPANGYSMMDAFGEDVRDAILKQVEVAGDHRWPVPGAAELEVHDMHSGQIKWVREKALGHPVRTVSEPASVPVPMAELSASYIKCTKPYGELYPEDVEALRDNPNWVFQPIPSAHWPMITDPARLTQLLIRLGSAQ